MTKYESKALTKYARGLVRDASRGIIPSYPAGERPYRYTGWALIVAVPDPSVEARYVTADGLTGSIYGAI